MAYRHIFISLNTRSNLRWLPGISRLARGTSPNAARPAIYARKRRWNFSSYGIFRKTSAGSLRGRGTRPPLSPCTIATLQRMILGLIVRNGAVRRIAGQSHKTRQPFCSHARDAQCVRNILWRSELRVDSHCMGMAHTSMIQRH